MARHKGGFTLIELLVTITLLSLGLLSLSSLFVSAIVSDTKTRYIQLASDRVQREMERLRSVDFNSVVVTNTGLFAADQGYTKLSQDALLMGVVAFSDDSLPHAVGRITLAYYNPGTGIYPSLKQVTVTLSWQGARLARGSVTEVILLANRPT